MTESWTEQTLDVTSEQHGTMSKMDSHNTEELDTSRMSAGFADVSQLADEEKEKLEALIDRLEEERRRMIATTELLASTQTSEHAEGSGEKYEKGKLRRELENVKHYNSDLERELDDLRQTMHPSPPPRTSTPFMPYASNPYHVQDPHRFPTPHHTHPKEAYGATGVLYVPDFKKPLISTGRDPDIRRIIDKYQPEKNGVSVLPSRPSPHQFGGSPSSQRSSPYMAPSPQGSPHQPSKSYGTHYPMIHREPHYERLKSGENPHLHGAGYPQSSPYLGDAQNGGQYHPTPTNRHRSHGSLGDIHAYQDTQIGYDEGVHDRSYKSQGNSPRSTRSRTPTRHTTSRRSGSRERATRPLGDRESPLQRDRSPHRSRESLNRDARRSPKALHAGYKNDESTADERPMSQEPHKKRGRSPHHRNTPPKQTHNGSPTTDRPHRGRGSKGPLSGKPNKPHAEEYWDQTVTPETTPKTSQSSMTSASDVGHDFDRNRARRSPASPTEKRNQKSRRSPASQSSRSGEKSPKQSRRASGSPRPRKSRESPNALHESLHRSDQRSHRSMDRDAPRSREHLSRGSPPVSQESLDRVGQRSHDRLAQSSSPYTSHESVNRRGQRSHDRLGKSSRDQLSSPEGSVRSGSSHGGRRRGSGARKERRPSYGSLVGPRKVVSCENLARAPGQLSHGSIDSVDTLHGGASNPSLESHGVYGTSNADTISPIPDTPRSFDPRREYTEEIDPYSQIHSSDHDITEKSCTDIEKAHSPIHTLKQSGTYLAPEVIQVRIQNEPPLQSSTLKSVSTSTDDSPTFQPKSTPKISDRVSKSRSKPSPGPDRSTTEVSSKSNASDALKEQKPTPRRRAKQKAKKEQKDTDSSSSSSSRTEPEGNMEPKFIESFNTDESFETPEEEMKFLVSKLQGMMPTLLEEDGERVQSVELKPAKPMHEVFVAAEQTRKAIRRFAEYAIAVAAGEI